MSSDRAPVEMASMAMLVRSPMRMIEPLPNCLSIWPKAISSALSRSTERPFCRGRRCFEVTLRMGCDNYTPVTPVTLAPNRRSNKDPIGGPAPTGLGLDQRHLVDGPRRRERHACQRPQIDH